MPISPQAMYSDSASLPVLVAVLAILFIVFALSYRINQRRGQKLAGRVDVGMVIQLSRIDRNSPAEIGGLVQAVDQKSLFVTPLEGEFFDQFIEKGETLVIRYWNPRGLYHSNSTVLEVAPERLEITAIENAVVVQRRELFRLDLQLLFSFIILDSKNRALAGMEKHTATTRNISASGLNMKTHLMLEEGDQLRVLLKLGEEDRLELFGSVVRVSLPAQEEKHREVAVEFLDISKEAQDLIVQHLFGHQVQLRKKGKLPQPAVSPV